MAKSKKTPAKKQQKKKSFFGFAVKWLFVLGLWCGIFLVGVVAWYSKDLPDITKQATFERKTSIIIKAADGSEIARYGELQGESLSIEDMSPYLVQAVLAIEDRRFYYHFGLDPIGLLRATAVNVKEQRYVQGGSTITQQLAKNLFLSRERTMKRKIQEALLAIWLEMKLSKDEILSAYLNRVYFGGGTYGVDAASQLYFHKKTKDLNIEEAATLAGLLKAPTRYSPAYNPALARQRAQVVIAAMKDAGYLKDTDEKDGANTPPTPTSKPGAPKNNQKYYADWILEQLEDTIGTPAEDIIVETTMNPDVQTSAEAALVSALEESGETKNISQGAVIVMRPNGEVVAIVGGKDYSDSEFNRATQAKRQPGSSFKPVVYLAALERGVSPDDLIMDEPFTTGRYRPKNFGNKYYGEVTIADALMLSLNTVAVQLAKGVGITAVVDMARRLGVTSDLEADLSLALGSSSVSPMEMARVYGTIANGGVEITPHGITKITSNDGELIYQYAPPENMKRVVSSYHVQALTGMMRRVLTNGTGRGAATPFPAAGKTGTSQNSKDAWLAGFSDQLVTIVWLGNDDNAPMKNVTGGSVPAKIWREVMVKNRGRYAPIYYRGGDFNFDGLQGLFDRLFSRETEEDAPASEGVNMFGNGWFQQETPKAGAVKDHNSERRYND